MAHDFDVVDLYLDLKHKIICEVNRGDNRQHEQRAGQWTFNRLNTQFPEVTEGIRGSMSDCFHRDDKIVEFWTLADKVFWTLL